ncbi:MAG: hypothetical protein JRI23_09215 [Deltaproteobacteria bacterium]|jgi:hypothetical protein|nr:hypothetical protein [Deltaproteobacteria bacterium]MBW2531818.1 hypothetical protein [Deltaproteobacteria bacterium]
MADHPAPQPHGPIEKIFDDLYWVQGTMRMGPGMRISRNMVLLREEGEVTVLNPVRLDELAETQLERIGAVKHIVRLGYFHGLDDRYYVERFGAKLWCQAGSDHYSEPRPDVVLSESTELPVSYAKLFVFQQSKHPECAVLVQRGGGLLVTCDSVQHHVDGTRCSLMAKVVMHLMGFMKPMNIGPPWKKRMSPEGGSLRSDFERLLELEFDLAVGGHGTVCRGGARQHLQSTVARVFD